MVSYRAMTKDSPRCPLAALPDALIATDDSLFDPYFRQDLLHPCQYHLKTGPQLRTAAWPDHLRVDLLVDTDQLQVIPAPLYQISDHPRPLP